MTLTVALDDTTGTATLRWSLYSGEATFATYRVLRNAARSTVVDTLATLLDPAITTYIDSSLAVATAYVYRIEVVNRDGYAAVSPAQSVPSLELPGVGGLRVEFDSRAATASLSWRRYVGPRFAAYQIRRTVGEAVLNIRLVEDVGDTTLGDTGLVGVVNHTYQVVVLTQSGEEAPGATASGHFHRQVAEWPLESDAFFPDSQFARLVLEPGNRIVVTMTTSDRVRVLRFNADGLEEETLIYGALSAQAVATALDGQGRRVATVSAWNLFDHALYRMDQEGQIMFTEREMFAGVLSEPLADEEQVVLGEIELAGIGDGADFSSLEITVGDEVFHEDFSFLAEELHPGDGQELGGWLFTGAE